MTEKETETQSPEGQGPREAVRTDPWPQEPKSGCGSPLASWLRRGTSKVIQRDTIHGRCVSTCWAAAPRSPEGEGLRGCHMTDRKQSRAVSCPGPHSSHPAEAHLRSELYFFKIVVKLNIMIRHFSHLEVYHSVAHIHSQRQLTISTAWTSGVHGLLPQIPALRLPPGCASPACPGSTGSSTSSTRKSQKPVGKAPVSHPKASGDPRPAHPWVLKG